MDITAPDSSIMTFHRVHRHTALFTASAGPVQQYPPPTRRTTFWQYGTFSAGNTAGRRRPSQGHVDALNMNPAIILAYMKLRTAEILAICHTSPAAWVWHNGRIILRMQAHIRTRCPGARIMTCATGTTVNINVSFARSARIRRIPAWDTARGRAGAG